MSAEGKAPWRLGARVLLAVVVGALALYFAFREVELKELAIAIRGASLPWLLAAVLISFSGHLMKALRWQTLLSTGSRAYRLKTLLKYILAGQLANLLIPFRAGDWGRALVLGSRGPGRAFTLGSVVLEKLLDAILYAALAATLLVFLPLPGGVRLSPVSMAGLALGGALLLLSAARGWERIERRLVRMLRKLPERLRAPFLRGLDAVSNNLFVFRRNRTIAALATWTALSWLSGLLVNEGVLRAFDLDLPLTASLMLLVVLQAGISTNLVPGALGVFEYLCVLVLGQFGVAGPAALAYGVTLHAVVLLPLLAGGLWAALAAPPRSRAL